MTCRPVRFSRAKLLVVGVVAFSLFAGCSQSHSPATARNSVEAKAAFVRRADKICKRGEQETEAEVKAAAAKYGLTRGKGPTSAQREALLVEVVVPSIKKQAAELAELPPPPGEGETVKAVILSIEEGVEKTEDEPALGLRQPGPFARTHKLAKAYGFKVCGR